MIATSKIMLKSFFTNFFLSLVKLIIGVIYKSSALIADGIHSFSDLTTDIVAILGGFLSGKEEDEEHPYGHGRIEYLTSAFIGLIVIAVGFILIWNMMTSNVSIPSKLVVFVSMFTILAKLILSRYLICKGKLLNNKIILSSGIESSMDVYSSIVVLISSILMQYEKKCHYLIYSDKIAGVIVGVLIVKTGFSIVKENINTLIGTKEYESSYYKLVEKTILKNKHIKRIDSLIIMKYGHYYTLNIELSMNPSMTLKSAHDEVEKIENCLQLMDERNKYIHIHMNPYEKDI